MPGFETGYEGGREEFPASEQEVFEYGKRAYRELVAAIGTEMLKFGTVPRDDWMAEENRASNELTRAIVKLLNADFAYESTITNGKVVARKWLANPDGIRGILKNAVRFPSVATVQAIKKKHPDRVESGLAQFALADDILAYMVKNTTGQTLECKELKGTKQSIREMLKGE